MKLLAFSFIFLILFSHERVSFSQTVPDQREVRGVTFIDDPAAEGDGSESIPQRLQVLLPEVDRSKSDTLSSKTKIYVNKISVSGNTVLGKETLRQLVAGYLDRYVSVDELQQLRYKLTQYYISKGYVNSGVILPDQKISDGTIKYQVIEGRLNGLTVKGNMGLNKKYIIDRINIDKDKPLNIVELQKSLKMLQQNSLIEQVNAVLEPGGVVGESVLIAEIKEAKSSMFAINVDNYNPPSVGAERLSVNYENYNLSGNGDSLLLNAGVTRGVNDFAISYTFPLSANNDALSFYYALNNSIVVEEPFSEIDLEGESVLSGILYSVPVIRGINSVHKILLGIETDESRNLILGEPIAFDPGADATTGISKTAVFQLGYDYMQRNRGSIFTWQAMLRYGLDFADSTINESSLPDSQFTSLRGQLQFANKLNFLESQLLLRSSMQYSNEPLLFIEKFVVGGFGSVRGYRENQYIRDNGILASIEWQIPLSFDDRGVNTHQLKLIPFFDTGYAKNDSSSMQVDSVSLSSVGVGVVWDPSNSFHFELYFAVPLDDVPEPNDDDLQNKGIHFSATYKTYF